MRKLRLQIRRLRGGLEASCVFHVTARFETVRGRRRTMAVVVKYLRGAAVREASVYERLVATHATGLSPQHLATERSEEDSVVLWLEAVRPISRWPWANTHLSGQVLDRLADLHSASVAADTLNQLAAWDYEAELRASTASTLELLEQCRRCFPALARRRPSAQRVAMALPAMRRQLLASSFGRAAIHGDMHPGNAMVRRRSGVVEPALLDWSRARIGSPLEDVSSWLQSLGYWEPEARRRHDSLLVRYLRARGTESRLQPDLRAAYWLAGASNAFSGALRYHLSVALEGGTTPKRQTTAVRSALDWLRVLRRADAWWN